MNVPARSASRPPLTVVVPCRDRADVLARSLDRLRAEIGDGDAIVVADSASRDPAVRTAAENAGATVVRCSLPGTSRARNAGWRAARTELVAFVDDDVMVQSGWADALVRELSDDRTGFVIGRTTLPADHAGGAVASVITVAPPTVITDAGTIGAAGGNVAVRRSALERAGGYDERLGPGTWFQAGEDLELLDRVIATGAVGRYAPSAVATHEQWRAATDAMRLQWAYGKGMGARVACALRRDLRTGLRMLPEVFRLGGLVTATRRHARRGEPAYDGAAAADEGPTASPLGNGWRGPVIWRLGAIVGLVAGVARLGPDRHRPDVDRTRR